MNTNDMPSVVIEEFQTLTLEEFCAATKTSKTWVIEMVEYQLLQPEGVSPAQWRFDSTSIHKARIASSFHYDLEVNLPGIALALDLLRQIEDFHHQIHCLPKDFQKNIK